MFERRRARRARANERAKAEAILADARLAAEAARKTLREARLKNPNRPPREDDLGDAIQSAILSSVLPSIVGAIRQPDTSKRHSRSSHGGGLVFLVGLAAGIGIAAWARSDPKPSLAEDDEWELANGANTHAAKEAINTTLDRVDVAVRHAVKAAAGGMGSAVDAVANAAGPTAERVSGQIKVVKDRASSEVIRALDDIEDVWGDDDAPTRPTRTVPKKPTPRKPVEGKPGSSSTTKKRAPQPRKPKD
jgi:hypothetical protein